MAENIFSWCVYLPALPEEINE